MGTQRRNKAERVKGQDGQGCGAREARRDLRVWPGDGTTGGGAGVRGNA